MSPRDKHSRRGRLSHGPERRTPTPGGFDVKREQRDVDCRQALKGVKEVSLCRSRLAFVTFPCVHVAVDWEEDGLNQIWQPLGPLVAVKDNLVVTAATAVLRARRQKGRCTSAVVRIPLAAEHHLGEALWAHRFPVRSPAAPIGLNVHAISVSLICAANESLQSGRS
eukprot:7126524-Prymnesium_polylepis.2